MDRDLAILFDYEFSKHSLDVVGLLIQCFCWFLRLAVIGKEFIQLERSPVFLFADKTLRNRHPDQRRPILYAGFLGFPCFGVLVGLLWMAFHPLRFVQAEFDAGECDLLEVLFFSSVGVMSAMMPMTADWIDSASSS